MDRKRSVPGPDPCRPEERRHAARWHFLSFADDTSFLGGVIVRSYGSQAAAQPVELPHDQRVTGSKRPEATREGRALGARACQSLVLVNVRTSGAFERGNL